jgi:hypothetical protein
VREDEALDLEAIEALALVSGFPDLQYVHFEHLGRDQRVASTEGIRTGEMNQVKHEVVSRKFLALNLQVSPGLTYSLLCSLIITRASGIDAAMSLGVGRMTDALT